MLDLILSAKTRGLCGVLFPAECIVSTEAIDYEVPQCFINQLIMLIILHLLTANKIFRFKHFSSINAYIFVEIFEKIYVFAWAWVADIQVRHTNHLQKGSLICRIVCHLVIV